MFNFTLKIRKTILFFLIVVINELICIESDIRLDTCTKEVQGMRFLFLAKNDIICGGVLSLNTLCRVCPWLLFSIAKWAFLIQPKNIFD